MSLNERTVIDYVSDEKEIIYYVSWVINIGASILLISFLIIGFTTNYWVVREFFIHTLLFLSLIIFLQLLGTIPLRMCDELRNQVNLDDDCKIVWVSSLPYKVCTRPECKIGWEYILIMWVSTILMVIYIMMLNAHI